MVLFGRDFDEVASDCSKRRIHPDNVLSGSANMLDDAGRQAVIDRIHG